ncbi:MAG TPA: glycosyltransferase [Acidimicrobiales bacterium]|nr:glycosyltransferase [Acidimicrobiales bacterium]
MTSESETLTQVPPGAPRVSVCVVADGDPTHLSKLLAALDSQSLGSDEYEIIVVENGSSDSTRSLLSDFASKSRAALRIVRNDSPAEMATALDQAWKAALAPLMAFIEPRFTPASGWLFAGIERLQRRPHVGYGLLLTQPGQEDRSGFLWNRYFDDSWQRRRFTTANLFCRRADLIAAGGWSSNIAGGTIDLVSRIVANTEATPAFIRNAVVYHDIDDTPLKKRLVRTLTQPFPPASVSRRVLAGGLFWQTVDWQALLALLGLVGILRDRRLIFLAVPWLHHRTCVLPLCDGPKRRWAVLPGVFVMDLLAVVGAARGASARSGQLVL